MVELQKKLLKETDYDVLIILDACRFDVFKEELEKVDTPWEGELKPVKSFAKNTPNFYEKLPKHINIHKHDLFTANPVPFHHNPEYEWNRSYLFDSIKPNNNFIELFEKYYSPEAIIHFVPPHLPWMSGEGREVIEEMNLNPENFPYKIKEKSYEQVVYSSVDNPMKYYREQMRFVIKELIDGWTEFERYDDVVITSDHSEGVTKKQGYEHLKGEVPWLHI